MPEQNYRMRLDTVKPTIRPMGGKHVMEHLYGHDRIHSLTDWDYLGRPDERRSHPSAARVNPAFTTSRRIFPYGRLQESASEGQLLQANRPGTNASASSPTKEVALISGHDDYFDSFDDRKQLQALIQEQQQRTLSNFTSLAQMIRESPSATSISGPGTTLLVFGADPSYREDKAEFTLSPKEKGMLGSSEAWVGVTFEAYERQGEETVPDRHHEKESAAQRTDSYIHRNLVQGRLLDAMGRPRTIDGDFFRRNSALERFPGSSKNNPQINTPFCFHVLLQTEPGYRHFNEDYPEDIPSFSKSLPSPWPSLRALIAAQFNENEIRLPHRSSHRWDVQQSLSTPQLTLKLDDKPQHHRRFRVVLIRFGVWPYLLSRYLGGFPETWTGKEILGELFPKDRENDEEDKAAKARARREARAQSMDDAREDDHAIVTAGLDSPKNVFLNTSYLVFPAWKHFASQIMRSRGKAYDRLPWYTERGLRNPKTKAKYIRDFQKDTLKKVQKQLIADLVTEFVAETGELGPVPGFANGVDHRLGGACAPAELHASGIAPTKEEAEDRRILSADRGGVIGIAFQAPVSEELVGREQSSDEVVHTGFSHAPQESKFSTMYPKSMCAPEQLLPFSFGADAKPSSYDEWLQGENKKRSQDPASSWQEKEIGDANPKKSEDQPGWMFRFRPHFGWGIAEAFAELGFYELNEFEIERLALPRPNRIRYTWRFWRRRG